MCCLLPQRSWVKWCASGCLPVSGLGSSLKSWASIKGLSWLFSILLSNRVTVSRWGTLCNPRSMCSSKDEITEGICSKTCWVFFIVDTLAKRFLGSFTRFSWDGDDWSMMWRRFEVERTACEIWSLTIVFAEFSREILLVPRDFPPLPVIGTTPVVGGVGEGKEVAMVVAREA